MCSRCRLNVLLETRRKGRMEGEREEGKGSDSGVIFDVLLIPSEGREWLGGSAGAGNAKGLMVEVGKRK